MLPHRDKPSGGSHAPPPDAASWRPVALVPARTPEGPITGCLETQAIDVADAEALRRALDRSEARCRRIAYLMAASGHDLRQPLQVIAMALDRLLPDISNPAQVRWMQIALGEVSGLAAGLTDLAVAARLTAPEPRTLFLQDIFGVAAASWRHHATARGLQLRIMPTRQTVRADARLLSTIVRNLVGNAVKHTRSGGVLVGRRRCAEGVRVDVIDTGPGLAAGELTRLFEPRQRSDSDPEGLGLGLAIVRDAAEQLGFALEVQSTVGSGSRFSLTIPG